MLLKDIQRFFASWYGSRMEAKEWGILAILCQAATPLVIFKKLLKNIRKTAAAWTHKC